MNRYFVATWLIALAIVLLPATEATANDRLKDKIKDRRARKNDLRKKGALPERPPNTPGERLPNQGDNVPSRAPSLVGMHHGSVGIIGDLARVDLTLTVTNANESGAVEWRQTYAIDPMAEVIGAVLRRRTGAPVQARTLLLADARRIYAEACRGGRRSTQPSRSTQPPRNRDPLRLERLTRERLSVVVFPVEAGETVSIDLTFVTPLRGRGAHRIYEDVMGGRGLEPQVVQPGVRPPRQPDRNRPTFVRSPDKAQWIVRTGGLVLDAEPDGMKLEEEWKDGTLRFSGVARTTAESKRPSIPLIVPQPENVAISVRSGGFGNRTALWRFDPAEYLRSKGLKVERTHQVRLLGKGKETSRIAPWSFMATADPLPVAAHVKSTKRPLRYTVQVLDGKGKEVARYEEEMPIRTQPVRSDLEVALTGWHRAALVRRVSDWAGPDDIKRETALRYAVDVGVLVQGTAALAVPSRELRQCSAESRRLYRQDGAVLGAQRREADLKAPPSGSLKED